MKSAALAPVAQSVRRVLSGTDDGISETVRRIAQPPGAPGWFGPQDPVWTVHGSVATFFGGIRSLLLQSLHPLALAGVQQHSRYRTDPFGRLQRTGAFIAATTFGSDELASRTVAGISRMHSRVQGAAPDGRSYSATDPRLLLWVHVALVDSMLTGYDMFGRSGNVDRDGYVANMALVGRRMGVVEPPRNTAELSQCLEGFRPELRRTRDTDQMIRFIMTAPLPARLRPGYALMAHTALDSLPGWSTDLLGRRRPWPMAEKSRRIGTDTALRVLAVALVASPAQQAGEQRLAGSAA